MKRLLIVGSGLTGASLSYLLSRVTKPDKLQVAIWDKARGAGGRMATVRSKKVAGCSVDLGAQFFSITPEYAAKHEALYHLLIDSGVLTPLVASVENQREFPTGTRHFVAPTGSSSVPKFFLSHSGVDVNFQHQVSRIDLSPNAGRWMVSGQGKMRTEVDAIVLTLPVPQMLTLKGNFLQLIDAETMRKLRGVDYTPRYALGMFFEPGTVLPGDWTAIYLANNPCVRFISKDHLKRGQDSEPPSLVAHTSALFSMQSVDAPAGQVQAQLLDDLRRLLPAFPSPVEMKLHKWRYSQVFREVEERPGCLLVNSQPPMLLAGDAFSHTNCNGCISSAKATMEEVLRTMPEVVA